MGLGPKSKQEEKAEKLMEIREGIGDTALLDMILAWWGLGDVVQFMEENSAELGLDDEESEEEGEEDDS